MSEGDAGLSAGAVSTGDAQRHGANARACMAGAWGGERGRCRAQCTSSEDMQAMHSGTDPMPGPAWRNVLAIRHGGAVRGVSYRLLASLDQSRPLSSQGSSRKGRAGAATAPVTSRTPRPSREQAQVMRGGIGGGTAMLAQCAGCHTVRVKFDDRWRVDDGGKRPIIAVGRNLRSVQDGAQDGTVLRMVCEKRRICLAGFDLAVFWRKALA